MMTRNDFLRLAAAGMAWPLWADVPVVRRPAAGRKLRLALVGCGGRATSLILNMLGEDVVALCDPDSTRFEVILNRMKAYRYAGDLSRIRHFRDYHDLYQKMGRELDAVVIATPNHHHAPAAIAAMRCGIHVYVEKPMALTIAEARLMRDVARQTGVATQVGNQAHTTEGVRRAVEYIRSGVLGEVKDVWCWVDRVNAFAVRPKPVAVPSTLAWAPWIGPCTRDVLEEGMHPHGWHAWTGLGNGSIGNMGTHLLDPAFWALDLYGTPPSSVAEQDCRPGGEGSWALRSTVAYVFPAHGKFGETKVRWMDGLRGDLPYDAAHVKPMDRATELAYANRPPVVEELERRHGISLGAVGALFLGANGAICLTSGGAITFVPDKIRKELPKPPMTLPREKHLTHMEDFFRAVRGQRPAGCDFATAEPVAEAVLLANVASRAGGGTLVWDGHKVVNNVSANAFLTTPYRKGHEVV